MALKRISSRSFCSPNRSWLTWNSYLWWIISYKLEVNQPKLNFYKCNVRQQSSQGLGFVKEGSFILEVCVLPPSSNLWRWCHVHIWAQEAHTQWTLPLANDWQRLWRHSWVSPAAGAPRSGNIHGSVSLLASYSWYIYIYECSMLLENRKDVCPRGKGFSISVEDGIGFGS